jgi:hypothetical protein
MDLIIQKKKKKKRMPIGQSGFKNSRRLPNYLFQELQSLRVAIRPCHCINFAKYPGALCKRIPAAIASKQRNALSIGVELI